jgi:CDP-paratose synthetase
MAQKILLTGVTGFLGSHLAKALLIAGYDLLALKRNNSSLNRIESITSNIKFIDVEDLDYNKIFKEHNNIDIIIHTATNYVRLQETASEILNINTDFPLKLLEAASNARVKVFINTDTVLEKYLNIYALSKNQFLQWGEYFAIHEKIKFINLRLEHFYGVNDDVLKFSSYILNECLINTPEIKLTKGEQKRDFIFIDDVVSAYMLILQKCHEFQKLFVNFDVGSGQSISIRSFVEIVHQLTGSSSRLDFGALPYRKGEMMNTMADTSGLLNLGWQCQIDLITGLKLVLEQEKYKS